MTVEFSNSTAHKTCPLLPEITRNQFCLFIYVWPLVLFISFQQKRRRITTTVANVKPPDLGLLLFLRR